MVATTPATTPPLRPGRSEDQFLPLPQNVHQARALALLGLNWLTANSPEQLKESGEEAVLRFGIEIEKLLCQKLGREWTPGGISIVSLLDELTPKKSLGLSPTQEPKYTTNGSAIVNRESGEAIPEDEPAFVFRARDALSVRALTLYLDMIGEREPTSAHAEAVERRINDFKQFAMAYPERMKWPDTGATK